MGLKQRLALAAGLGFAWSFVASLARGPLPVSLFGSFLIGLGVARL